MVCVIVGLGGFSVIVLLCIYVLKPLWEWLYYRCSCDLCGKLFYLSKYLFYTEKGTILLILIVPVAVVATAILISISCLILPFLLPIYLLKWLIDKLGIKERVPGKLIVP